MNATANLDNNKPCLNSFGRNSITKWFLPFGTFKPLTILLTS